MKYVQMLLTASALLAAPAVAQASKTATTDAAANTATATAAATPVAVAPNAMIFSADGRRIGRVDHVRGNRASVIFAGHFVDVPLSTLSVKDGGFVSSMSTAQIISR